MASSPERVSGGLSRSRLIHLSVGLVFSGVFLYFFLSKFNVDSVLEILAGLNYFGIVWVLIVTMLYLYAKAVRWQIMIAPLKKLTLMSSFANVSIGLMANNVLPARAGELVRVASLSKTEDLRAPSVLSALIVERVLDGYVLVVFFVVSSYMVDVSSALNIMSGLRKAAMGAFLIYSAVLVTMVLFMRFGVPGALKRAESKWAGYIMRRCEDFLAGMVFIKDFKRFIMILLLSVLVWILAASITLVTLYMFISLSPDIFSHIGMVESMFLIGAVSLGLMLPSAPGYFGSFHWLCSTIVVGLGMSKPLGDSFAVFLHGTQYIIITIVGLLFFLRHHLNIRKLLSKDIGRGD